MNTPTATITHLFHSGFAVETATHFLIFDYYQPSQGKTTTIEEGIITSDYLKTKKNILVFVSHNHGDHFDPRILEWAKDNPAITYIFSSDVTVSKASLTSYTLSAYETVKVGQVFIQTFGSTDQGISFHLELDGLKIFHAGDLNWWHWSGESPHEQSLAAATFKAEMEKLTAQNLSIDIAFFPIDRRMEEFYSIGAEYFADKLRPSLLVPMHFGNDFTATTAFAEKAKGLNIPTVIIEHRGQKIFF